MRTGSHLLSARASIGRFAIVAVVAAAAGCGDLQRQGTGSSYLIVEALEAAPGAEPETFGGTLASDVITVVEDVAGIYGDLGRVSFTLAMKDPGITAPSSANFITLTQYRVRFIRSDGRNTQGVDVPYAFDGAMTLTVSGSSQGVFTLVRVLAKSEAPLRALNSNGLIISTIAEVTFYGHDQTGRDVSVTAAISVSFGNFVDPDA
jgi:hypothetical protein